LLSVALAFGGCVIEETTHGHGHGGGGAQAGTTSPGGAGGGAAGGGTGGTPPPACDPYVARPSPPELLIGPTGLQQRLLDLMAGAQSRIDLMMYQLSTTPLIYGLTGAQERGVTVRVSLDYDQYANQNAIDKLTAAGVEVRPAPAEFKHAHAKVMIVDGALAAVMSANMNSYSMQTERNYGVVDHDVQDVADLSAIFERDWAGSGDIDQSCTRLIVSPLNARQRLTALISGAQQSLDMAIMYLSDNQIEDAVIARAQSGVAVRVLLAHPEWIDSNPATAAELSAAGIATKYLYAYELHAKLIIADGVPFVGSENLSYTSLERNREVGMLLTEPEPVGEVLSQFESDWSAGVPAP